MRDGIYAPCLLFLNILLLFSFAGLVQYAAMCCNSNIITSIKGACRIGKLAMAALKKFDFVSDMMPRLLFIYNVFIGMYTQRVQLCADNLRRGKRCFAFSQLSVSLDVPF